MLYGINDQIEINLEGRRFKGKLVDIDLRKKRFKLETKDGSYWITQGQIVDNR